MLETNDELLKGYLADVEVLGEKILDFVAPFDDGAMDGSLAAIYFLGAELLALHAKHLIRMLERTGDF